MRKTCHCVVVSARSCLVYIYIYIYILCLLGSCSAATTPLLYCCLTAHSIFINNIVVAKVLPRGACAARSPPIADTIELLETTGLRVALYPFVVADIVVGQHTGRISRIPLLSCGFLEGKLLFLC